MGSSKVTSSVATVFGLRRLQDPLIILSGENILLRALTLMSYEVPRSGIFLIFLIPYDIDTADEALCLWDRAGSFNMCRSPFSLPKSTELGSDLMYR